MYRILGVSIVRISLLVFLAAFICLPANYLIHRRLFMPTRVSSAASLAKDTQGTNAKIKEGESLNTRIEASRGGDGETNRKSSEVFVVILAQWRFGSSIIGELFNQNPNMFYVYEPLWVFSREAMLPNHRLTDTYDYQVSPKENFRRVLRGIPRCDFSEDFVTVMNTSGGKLRNKLICENTVDVDNCNMSNSNWLASVCKRSGGRAATKLIRADLNTIKSLIVDDHINVKVVNLVRDPRGATASRVHYDLVLNHRSLDLVALSDQIPKKGRLEPLGYLNNTRPAAESLPAMCDLMQANFRKASNLPSWLANRYKLIRFEDFAENPVNITHEIYDFVGLPLPTTVRDWVAEHTNVSHDQPEESDMFSSMRNARDVAKRWMTDLTALEIRQVEDICHETMQLLGYNAYDELKKSTGGLTSK